MDFLEDNFFIKLGDSLLNSNELDIFTFETFHNQIEQHSKKNSKLIIAKTVSSFQNKKHGVSRIQTFYNAKFFNKYLLLENNIKDIKNLIYVKNPTFNNFFIEKIEYYEIDNFLKQKEIIKTRSDSELFNKNFSHKEYNDIFIEGRLLGDEKIFFRELFFNQDGTNRRDIHVESEKLIHFFIIIIIMLIILFLLLIFTDNGKEIIISGIVYIIFLSTIMLIYIWFN